MLNETDPENIKDVETIIMEKYKELVVSIDAVLESEDKTTAEFYKEELQDLKAIDLIKLPEFMSQEQSGSLGQRLC